MPQSEEAQIPQLPAQSPVVHAESLSQADVCRNASPCECLAVEKTIEPCFALALFRQLVSRVMLLTRAPQVGNTVSAVFSLLCRVMCQGELSDWRSVVVLLVRLIDALYQLSCVMMNCSMVLC